MPTCLQATFGMQKCLHAMFQLGKKLSSWIKIFEEEGGKTWDVQNVTEEALQAQKDTAQDSMSISFASLMLGYAGGNTIMMEETLQKIPHKLISVRDYARQVLA